MSYISTRRQIGIPESSSQASALSISAPTSNCLSECPTLAEMLSSALTYSHRIVILTNVRPANTSQTSQTRPRHFDMHSERSTAEDLTHGARSLSPSRIYGTTSNGTMTTASPSVQVALGRTSSTCTSAAVHTLAPGASLDYSLAVQTSSRSPSRGMRKQMIFSTKLLWML